MFLPHSLFLITVPKSTLADSSHSRPSPSPPPPRHHPLPCRNPHHLFFPPFPSASMMRILASGNPWLRRVARAFFHGSSAD
ncbi:uncharacterized protein B0T23DRAFT_373406, partial [Neurospora hispaniola]